MLIEIDNNEYNLNTYGLIYALDKIEIKGHADLDIYGSIVTNSSEGNALELKDDEGILTTHYNSTGVFNEGYKTTYWKEFY